MSWLRIAGLALAWSACAHAQAQEILPTRPRDGSATAPASLPAPVADPPPRFAADHRALALEAERGYVRRAGTEWRRAALSTGLSAAALLGGGLAFRAAWEGAGDCPSCAAPDQNRALDATGLILMPAGATALVVSTAVLWARVRRQRQEARLTRELGSLPAGARVQSGTRAALEAQREYVDDLGTDWVWPAGLVGASCATIIAGIVVNLSATGRGEPACVGCEGGGFDHVRARRGAVAVGVGSAVFVGSLAWLIVRAQRAKRFGQLGTAIERLPGDFGFAPPIPTTGFRGGLRYHLTF